MPKENNSGKPKERETKTFETPNGHEVEIFTWLNDYQEKRMLEPMRDFQDKHSELLSRVRKEAEQEANSKDEKKELVNKKLENEIADFSLLVDSNHAKVRSVVKRIDDVESSFEDEGKKVLEYYRKYLRQADRQKILDETEKVVEDIEDFMMT